MKHFTSSQGFTVYPALNDSGPFVVAVPHPTDPGGAESDYRVNTMKDECSCAALQGIACEHKSAVDEYVEQAASQIVAESAPAPDVTQPATASHQPKYDRRQIGMTDTKPARPVWETWPSCSCGWKDDTPSATKDVAKLAWRAHRDAATNTTPAPIFPNREAWLAEATRHIQTRAALLQLGDNPPPVRVACGFTYGKGRRIGECWRKEQSGDGTFEIIVHNKMDDPVNVLACLTHELGHTYMERDTGHRTPFKRWAKAMGLVGPFTATTPGEELTAWLTELAGTLGTYPHAALDSARRIREGGPKKQTNRWLKFQCNVPDCGWIVRATRSTFKGACLSELHFNGEDLLTIGIMVPQFTTEPTPEPEGPEDES